MNLPSSKPEEEQYQKIRPSDALKTLSSQGCSVDIYAKSNKLTFGVTTIPPRNDWEGWLLMVVMKSITYFRVVAKLHYQGLIRL